MPRWDVPASLFLHLLIAALLVFGLPVSPLQPAKEQAINVHLVPPPKPPAQAKAQRPPPPEEAKAGKPREESKETSKRKAVGQPVFQFGEKDSGPRKALDGNSARDGQVSPPPKAAELLAPKPGDAAKVTVPLKLQEAKKLYSRAATGDLVATTAKSNLPRGERATRLCFTELHEQLVNASPPYFPDQLPAYPMNKTTHIEIRSAAFQSAGQWYKFSYRCEVDADATKVVSFGFHVGDPIPPSEWKRLGLPAQ